MQMKFIANICLLAGLAGCASLPTSGPTGKQIEQSLRLPDGKLPIQIIEVGSLDEVPTARPVAATGNLPDLAAPPTDMVGPGDVLDISIYEAGVTLFSSGGGGAENAMVGVNPGVQVQKLPPSRVDDNGDITIPYGGKLRVLGRTVGEVEGQIQRALRGLSQNPKVLVTLSESITNSVIVSGEVNRPGRLVLQTNHETLSDVVALAGGYRGNARDLILRVIRQSRTVDIRFNALIDNPGFDVPAYPGDRFMLIQAPQSYSVLGAPGKVEQFGFSRSSVSLAEAMASAGGVSAGSGDPAAIFLFRYVKNEAGADTPVVYHVNMMKAGSYLLAQRFAMQDQDVLYIGNATANQPSKLLNLVSQLFTPLVTVTAAVQTLQN
ncbi:MAG: polysaccharide biosynthesis/export family protein [Novosphingobium sp.]|uniref:polysaccharide biosynthesis/export family protein n=1 Tax=Novosphingobium sp. TaxID=1874826 RepID=UPI002734ACDC|nr:polysaccharide biosynthesis/export family protein [Novosphingobium sp.]MDP3549108.1 polysaccharide biosynthesis/export family protein [Novosphingobium sp.]